MQDELKWLAADDLIDPPVVLRLVDRGSTAYLELRDSIADRGVLNPILVRRSARFPGQYEVADGLYRATCCREVGRSPVPCLVKDLTDDNLLSIQIQANALRPETTPMEYARQIMRIMEARPQATLAEISSRVLHKSPTWVSQTLGLLRLNKTFQVAVERGEMPLGCAYELARVAHRFQAQFFDAARTRPVAEFRETVQAFLKRYQEAERQGKLDAVFTDDFKPQAYMRPVKEVREELEKPSQAALVVTAAGCKTLTDAWRAALAWVLHLDRESVEVQRQALINRARKRKEPPDQQQ